jgi:hypothetical protein
MLPSAPQEGTLKTFRACPLLPVLAAGVSATAGNDKLEAKRGVALYMKKGT